MAVCARAQQPDRLRRIGILMPLEENDPEAQRRIAAFSRTLRQIGWVEGQSVVFETPIWRWNAKTAAGARRRASGDQRRCDRHASVGTDRCAPYRCAPLPAFPS